MEEVQPHLVNEKLFQITLICLGIWTFAISDAKAQSKMLRDKKHKTLKIKYFAQYTRLIKQDSALYM